MKIQLIKGATLYSLKYSIGSMVFKLFVTCTWPASVDGISKLSTLFTPSLIPVVIDKRVVA